MLSINYSRNKIRINHLARFYFDKFGMNKWKLCFNRTKKNLGICDHDQKIIFLSIYLLKYNKYKIIKDIFLHELAHALIGYKHNHNEKWKRAAKLLGCSETEAIYQNPDLIWILPEYIGECRSCNLETKRYNKPYKNREYYCCNCGRKIKFQKIK